MQFSQEFITKILSNLLEWMTDQLPTIIILIVVTWIVMRINKVFIKRMKKGMMKRIRKKQGAESQESEKRVETLLRILQSVLRMIILGIFIMIFLKKFGVDIGPILAGAGILGLAVGFGAQTLVRDYISGFFILLENQIRVGDFAILNGTGGMVESIELRTTTLRDLSGTTHTFQNGKIDLISNMSMEWSAITLDVGVAYKEDVDEVMKIMKQVGDDLTNDEKFKDVVLEPLEIFGLNEFADSAIVIKARIKTQPLQQWAVGREYRRRLKKAFDENGIEIPFPHTTVYWGEEINPLKLKVEEQVKENNN
ncbi:MAG: mechanosensitive ion channel family protein [Bacteroidales bacterium]